MDACQQRYSRGKYAFISNNCRCQHILQLHLPGKSQKNKVDKNEINSIAISPTLLWKLRSISGDK